MASCIQNKLVIPLVCTQCGVQFKLSGALKRHQKTCKIIAKCPFCPKIYNNRNDLVKHVETHRPGYYSKN